MTIDYFTTASFNHDIAGEPATRFLILNYDLMLSRLHVASINIDVTFGLLFPLSLICSAQNFATFNLLSQGRLWHIHGEHLTLVKRQDLLEPLQPVNLN